MIFLQSRRLKLPDGIKPKLRRAKGIRVPMRSYITMRGHSGGTCCVRYHGKGKFVVTNIGITEESWMGALMKKAAEEARKVGRRKLGYTFEFWGTFSWNEDTGIVKLKEVEAVPKPVGRKP